ncbi:aminopeptidase P family protein [uncultured Clostridium sp.]|uniref:aminopeptidase P family protein n=1 Tax=uncultured Clostridium sp. TaxID=59620 RepID=UPI00261E5D45|nr:aminopeptidase P family protein [uncultured Clostridium sp.]
MKINKRIERLRKEMVENSIDYYIIPSEDAHQSEYVPEYYRGRAYISGFTGSAGTLLLGREKGILWTDGRYFIQAEKELEGSGIEMFKMRIPGWPTLLEWLTDNIKEGETIGFDGKTISVEEFKGYSKLAEEKLLKIKLEKDLLEKVWIDRPELPKEKIFIHEVKYAGKGRKEKINEVRNEMSKLDVDSYIIASLDDIAWLFNLRGNDVKNNPVFLSYAIVESDRVTLFIDLDKVDNSVRKTLEEDEITLKDYNDILEDVRNLQGKVLIDENKVSAMVRTNLLDEVEVIEKLNITTTLKAIKNDIEIENLKKCQVKDGIAMVKFMKWLKENIVKGSISEISAAEKIKEFRSELALFKGTSFDSICAHKEHGAMMHYSATKDSNYNLESKGFLLLDSGGQYLDGTTDITRTFILGDLTEEERKDFTLVLKSHINLLRTRFLKGISGSNLDIKARQPLWDEGIDYKCGTGHGVGFFLNVHEGPQSISPVPNKVALEPGMILTNEPGVYRKGKHGIRTENTMLVVKDIKDEEFGEFYKFQVISYCPIDLDGIDKELLSKEERNWLNEYHKETYDKISEFLTEDEKEFLKKYTKAL